MGITLLNKRVGITTKQLFDVQDGQHIACLGPLGRPFSLVDPDTEAWMVAGGVGLAPFATLAEALGAKGVPMTLFYGGRSTEDLFYIELFEHSGADLVIATEDGTRGEHGRVTQPLERALAARGETARGAVRVRPRADARSGRAPGRPPRRAVRSLGRTGHGVRPRRLLQLCCAGAGRAGPAALRAIVRGRARV